MSLKSNEMDMISDWDRKRYQVVNEIRDAYKQYEQCIAKHSILHSVYCKPQQIKVDQLRFEYHHLTKDYDRWIKTNNISVKPVSKPF